MGISGNTSSIKKEVIAELEEIQAHPYPRDLLVDPGLAAMLAKLSCDIKREIAVYIDRRGYVREISIGDKETAPLAREQVRRGNKRLSGLRCIHTHPSGSSALSSLDFNSLLVLRLDAMVALGTREGRINGIQAAFISPAYYQGETEDPFLVFGPFGLDELASFPFQKILREIDRKIIIPEDDLGKKSGEKALLVGFKERSGSLLKGEDSLLELEELARTAGADVAVKLLLNTSHKDPGLYIGKGKARELHLLVQQESLDLVILDDELTHQQQKNLEGALNCRVIDRSALILQIFADRARTREGKLQVELAQLNYLLPRLQGYGGILSRLGGGIGTRGPGETKLETDRRLIRKRISDLNKEIEDIKKQRQVLRQRREFNQVPVVALVGYTNAGKSSLLNALTNAGVPAEDKLFATLDPTARRLELRNEQALLIDTVGFINKLPHQLVASFRATLEEVKYADLLLHVVDASNPLFPSHIKTVEKVLEELGALDKPTILVFNKWDLLEDPILLRDYLAKCSPSLEVSALTKYNLDKLKNLVEIHLPGRKRKVSLLIPFAEAASLTKLYQKGEVVSVLYIEEGVLCEAFLHEQEIKKMQRYLIHKESTDELQ